MVPPCPTAAYKLGRRKGCCHPCDSEQNVNIVLEPENWNVCSLWNRRIPRMSFSRSRSSLSLPWHNFLWTLHHPDGKEGEILTWLSWGVLSRISDPVVCCLSIHKRKRRKLGAELLERYYSLLPLPDPESYRQDELMGKSQ